MPHPEKIVQNPGDYNMVNTGSFGMFICSENNPFDASLLTGEDEGKMGVAVQFMSFTGDPVAVSNISTSGVLGDLDGLSGPFAPGTGLGITVTEMTITGDGYAYIYLKK